MNFVTFLVPSEIIFISPTPFKLSIRMSLTLKEKNVPSQETNLSHAVDMESQRLHFQ